MRGPLMWVVFPNMLVVMCRCYVGLPCTTIVARFSVITSWVCVTFDLYVKLGRECCSLVDRVNKHTKKYRESGATQSFIINTKFRMI